MLRKAPLCFVAIFLAALSISALADVVVLKTGDKVEGKITAETDTEITIEEKISAGITDTRVIKKSEVTSVSKEAADEGAWQPLKGHKVGANSLPAASYDSIINPLKGFATQFPQSKYAAEAQKLADAFAEEKKRVDGGEVKMDNKWLSKDDVQKERYQISALLAFNYMKEQSTRDLVGALNTFEVIETKYPGARIYPDAVELAKRILPALKPELDRRSASFAAARAEREKAIQAASGAQRNELVAADRRERDASDAANANFDRQNLKWTPLAVANDRALQRMSGRIPSEQGRLVNMPIAKMRESLQLSDKAKQAIDTKDFAAADEAANLAVGAWPSNEIATRLRDEIQIARSTASASPATSAPVAATNTDASVPSPAAVVPAEEPQAEPEKPFLLTPVGAVVVVIVIGLLVAAINVFKKIKSKASDVLE